MTSFVTDITFTHTEISLRHGPSIQRVVLLSICTPFSFSSMGEALIPLPRRSQCIATSIFPILFAWLSFSAGASGPSATKLSTSSTEDGFYQRADMNSARISQLDDEP